MNFAQISYNIHCNFTNYGSALQSWALSRVIEKLGHKPVLVDYCPDCLADKDPLHPMKNMWDVDRESRQMCELSLPAIRINYHKFDYFYTNHLNRTRKCYTKHNIDELVGDENIDGFICGSDTIFCIDEFGFDDGYYANYPCMKEGYSISYAASFGDAHFTDKELAILNDRIGNFKALGIREHSMLPYLREHTSVPVQQVLDPTLLLDRADYDSIAFPDRLEEHPYLLLYARRYDKRMFDYAEQLASSNNWRIVDISLRACNAGKHRMFYEAGVEEFLSLIRHAEYVVTNSFHGVIMATQYRRPFVVFSREQCDTKIDELLALFNLSERKFVNKKDSIPPFAGYDDAIENIEIARATSLRFLRDALTIPS